MKDEGSERRTRTVAECARILGVSELTIRRAIRDGRIPSIPVSCRRIMISAKFIDDLLGAAAKGKGSK